MFYYILYLGNCQSTGADTDRLGLSPFVGVVPAQLMEGIGNGAWVTVLILRILLRSLL